MLSQALLPSSERGGCGRPSCPVDSHSGRGSDGELAAAGPVSGGRETPLGTEPSFFRRRARVNGQRTVAGA